MIGVQAKPRAITPQPLVSLLRERIAREGPLSVHDYMDACLADRSSGYYTTHQPIGRTGDFITAPEVSQVFGRPEPGMRKIISRARNKLRRFLDRECYLFNPDGNCKCRMKAAVKGINLDKEFGTLRKTVRKMRFYREAENVLPRKNFWKKIA